MRNLTSIAFILLTLLVGCGSNDPQRGTTNGPVTGNGGGTEPKVGKLNGADYTILAGEPGVADTRLSGSGSIVFSQVRLDPDNNYELNFTLPEAGSSVTVIGNANERLENGVAVMFSRKADGKLEVRVLAGNEDINLEEQLTEMSATGNLSFPIDIHQHGDMIIDLPGGDLAGTNFTLRPSGNHWGLKLNNATVTKAVAAEPKHPH